MTRRTSMLRLRALAFGATALLAVASPVMADDGTSQAQRAQRGGLTGAVQQATGTAPDATLPAPPPAPVLAPESADVRADAIPAQRQQASQQASTPAANTLPALPPLGEDQLSPAQVSIGPTQELGAAVDSQLDPVGTDALAQGQVAIDPSSATALEPAPAQQQASQTQAPEKKPGFFKRMWTKVKTFFAGVKAKFKKSGGSSSQAQDGPLNDVNLGGGGDGAGAAGPSD